MTILLWSLPLGADPDDAARFTTIFEESYAKVLAFSLRRCDSTEAAEEAVAETFLIAWRRLSAVPAEPLPWLLGTARKVIANQHRSIKRRHAAAPTIDLEQVEPVDPTTPVADQVVDRQALAQAFTSLKDVDREVLTLTAWDGLEAQEAAVVMGCSPAVFSLRLHRARTRLARELASYGD